MKKVLSSVILGLLLSFSNANAEILYGLENPEFGVPASGIGMISLWAFSTTPGAIMEVDVEVDGKYLVPLSCGGERGDVKNKYPQYANALNSNCATSVNWGNIPPGVHSLNYWINSSIGESKTETRLVTTVRFGDARFADSFDLSQATSFVDQSTSEVVLTNVKVRNGETGVWTTTNLRFRFVVSLQGLQLSSAFIAGGDDKINYVFDPGADGQEIKNYVVESLAYLKQEAGGSPTDFTVFAFSNLDLLVDAYMSFLKIHNNREEIYSRWQNGIGEAGYDYVFIYLGDLWTQRTQELRLKTVIHELTHVQQNHLVGFPGLIIPGGTRDTVPFGGPRWLIEGVAMLAVSKIGDTNPGYWLDQCNGVTLQSMEAMTGILAAGSCPTYNLQLLAVHYMGFPFKIMMEFWQKVRTEGDWKKAFVIQFGRNVDEFYTAFEQYRATL